MENLLSPDKIATHHKSIASILNEITTELLSIEAHDQSENERINDIKLQSTSKYLDVLQTINREYHSSLKLLQNEYENVVNQTESTYQSAIKEARERWDNATYVYKIASGFIEKWRDNYELLLFPQVISGIATGAALLTGSWQFFLIFCAPTFLIVHMLRFFIKENIARSNSIQHSKNIESKYSQEEVDKLKSISLSLKSAINNEKSSALIDLEKFCERTKSDHKIVIEQINKRYEADTLNLESDYKTKSSQAQLIIKNLEAIIAGWEVKNVNFVIYYMSVINYIAKIVKQLDDTLNTLPETFSPKILDWSNNQISKGKDQPSSIIRIGHQIFSITLATKTYSVQLPWVVPFLTHCNILYNCSNSTEIGLAVKSSHNVIARSLLALPAGKLKITFIDPAELGANVAPFTPLLKEVYGGLVYTQRGDIENQLSSLIRAIENVIQKYLQDRFLNIAEFNFKEKEVPEPYRMLVVYNFPQGFDDSTVEKLLNIMKSGPKAGVHTILICNQNLKLPYGLNWDNIKRTNTFEISLTSKKAENLNTYFDEELPYSNIVSYINDELPRSNSIKVPFTNYIEPVMNWWKEKSDQRFMVPIGRHGREVQNLTFDNEDDNQALLIGKPGSGKSNLLHVIIANSLWKYSPDQLEIYLIDFKGGVEFTIYADKKIPHIRTIAIESEREFGLSVLEGVEKELLRREIEYSRVGVQNIQQYHEMFPEVRMPRVLLIVDEFQEFYAEDDSIKQAVDDKFDRIVRKGRAFGINTLFSSQTLSGNSIKKSTKELIDIRIALMCSDLDAGQILDDRNPAARDLTRPGEAIYNSENGKIAGNRRFQVFFIEKKDLTETIESVVKYAEANEFGVGKFKQIIFRGSEKAYIEKEDHPLKMLTAQVNPKSLSLWVGEPVAIADDVITKIRKQGGSNLLVAGSDENIGLRVMCSSIVSIAAQQQKKTCVFYSFNFYNVDSEMVNIPDLLFQSIGHEFFGVNTRKIKETLEEVKNVIDKRLESDSKDLPNIYLCLFSLQRGRSFRKDGYTMSEEGNLLAYILKEGPDVGVFTLLEVDNMDNFAKNLDDNLLREFSQRIASQMNPENSVKIIGNQKASRLGQNRALYYDDNENTLVKFKPYEYPNFNWVEKIGKPKSSLL